MMRRGVVSVVIAGAVLSVGAIVFVLVALLHTVPPVTLVRGTVPRRFPGQLSRLAWPREGEAALAVRGLGMMASHGPNRPVPIGSVAKIMTALVVLRDHPLPPDDQGPVIEVTPADVATYRADRGTDQSVAAVKKGEQLTELQALETLLLPSANNMATLLARWDAGDEAIFVAKMNAEARTLGLTETHYADASGLSPASASTATDQVRLAVVALRQPALAQIAALRRATVPVAGLVHNLDTLLGSHGVVGIKTGSTSAAGGCFVFAARRPLGHRRVTLVGAVLGQPGPEGLPTVLKGAFAAATSLLKSLPRVLETFDTVAGGITPGRLTAPWARPVAVRFAHPPPLIGWSGLPLRITIVAPRHFRAPLHPGQRVGRAIVRAGPQMAHVELVASRGLPSPSLGWRLSHP